MPFPNRMSAIVMVGQLGRQPEIMRHWANREEHVGGAWQGHALQTERLPTVRPSNFVAVRSDALDGEWVLLVFHQVKVGDTKSSFDHC